MYKYLSFIVMLGIRIHRLPLVYASISHISGQENNKNTHVNSFFKNGTLAKFTLNCFIEKYSEALPNLRSLCKQKYDNGNAGGAKDIIEDCWPTSNELFTPFENKRKSRNGMVFSQKL